MIEVAGIKKSFKDVTVLHGINSKFEKGLVNLVIGRSGSGKTVLLKTMVGLIKPDEGQVLYEGNDFISMNIPEQKKLRKEIGMVFQSNALFDSQTIEDNVKFPLDMFSDFSEEEKQVRVKFCLDRVDVIGKNKLFPSEISGGMQKRVAIARAIALNPKYLFCDEPNSGLDPRTAILIDNLIKEITVEYNIVTIINTHDMNSVMEIGDKVMYIHKGQKWWEGTREDIWKADNKELEEFIFASEFAKKIKEKMV
ncbi:MAG: ATP-binding cassette domain-containing protein [Bacteroidales bacterium]